VIFAALDMRSVSCNRNLGARLTAWAGEIYH
jgi:hypothetical protein